MISKAGLKPRAPSGAIRTSADAEHLVLRPELDRHGIPARGLGVERGLRRSHHERRAHAGRGQRQRERSHLVHHVAVGGHPIGAHHDRVDHPARDDRGARRIHDDPVVRSEALQLPGREAAALQQRPGLTHVHQTQPTQCQQRVDDTQCGPPFDGREGPGVAMRVEPKLVGADQPEKQPGSGGRDRPVHLAVLGQDPQCLVLDRCGTLRQARRHAIHATREVHRRRPGSSQPLHGGPQRGLVPARSPRLLDGEQHANGPSGTQRWGTADGQPTDRVDQLVHGRDPQLALLSRQSSLIEQDDVIVRPVDGAHGTSTDFRSNSPRG